MSDAPERLWVHPTDDAYFVAMPHETDGAEYIRADIARADAELAVAEAIRRAAEIADGYHRRAIEWVKKVRGLDQHIDETDGSRISDDIRALAPADALAEVQRLREALAWCSGSDDFQVGGKAREGWVKLCAPLLAARAALDEDAK